MSGATQDPSVTVPRRYREQRESFVAGNRVTLLRDGAEAFPAMLAVIEGAERQVFVESYCIGGNIGQRFVDALVAARRRDVEVAVLYDSVGSLDADESLFTRLREAGAHVLEFEPLLPWRARFHAGRISMRDHRKLLVVDDAVGFTGGINLADAWAPVEQGGEGWRDDWVELVGPAVAGLAEAFRALWHTEGGPPLLPAQSLAPSDAASTAASQEVRVLSQAHGRGHIDITRAYLTHIWHAKQRVWLRNSYFVPEHRVARALRKAALRGVDVRVIVPGRIDLPFMGFASRGSWAPLLRAGVRIFEWQGNVLHAKSAVIDGDWSTIGTFNLDHRSIFSNLEINLAVRDEPFGRAMERSFLLDLAGSREIEAQRFESRPRPERLRDWLFYQFRSVL